MSPPRSPRRRRRRAIARLSRGTTADRTDERTTLRMAATDNPTPGTAAMPMTVLLTEEMLRERVAALARALDADYAGSVPVLVGVLTGATIFMADLVRQMRGPVETETMPASLPCGRTAAHG